MQRAKEVIERVGKDFLVYSGDDATAVELMLLGGQGQHLRDRHVAPRAMSDLCAAAMRGDAAAARAIQRSPDAAAQGAVHRIQPHSVKWALHEMGLIPEGIRLPLTWLSPRCHEPLRQAMRQTGVLA
ncbi:dihydrodipicolinate synthase family protein [Pseudomonas aeruginosa]|uniref:dihydrodipicolinate synthase family protein n=1 Tax=Pseudomonas aeruginosa TaxID=287 RepID=UPI003D291843